MFTSLTSNLRDYPINSEDLYLPHISLFKDRILPKDFTHAKAGILSLSEKVYTLICSASQPIIPSSKQDSSRIASKKNPLLYEDYQKKMECYGSLTLRSENNYLKSYINELEDDFQKVYKFNQEMVKANKSLEAKLNTCQEKVDYFISYYQNIIDNVNALFSKTESYLLSSYKLNRSISQSRNTVPQQDIGPLSQPKLTFLFSKEVSDLKGIFHGLQDKIALLNKHNFDLEVLNQIESAIENHQTPIFTSGLENRQSLERDKNLLDSNKDVNTLLHGGNEGCRSRFSVSNWWRSMEKNRPSEKVDKKAVLNSTRKTIKTPRGSSHDRESADSFLVHGTRKPDESILSHINASNLRKSATPLKSTLKERIEEMLKPALNSNHTRHSSLSYFNSLFHHGGSTRCSSTKGSIPSNMISPDANNKYLDFLKDKAPSNIKNKEQTQTDVKQTTNVESKVIHDHVEQAKPSKTPDSRNRVSNRLRINEILENKPSTSTSASNSFNIPTLNINKIIPLKQEKTSEDARINDSNKENRQDLGNVSRFSSRETYDFLKSFRKPMKDLHVDLSAMNLNEKQENKSSVGTRNPSSNRYRGSLNWK